MISDHANIFQKASLCLALIITPLLLSACMSGGSSTSQRMVYNYPQTVSPWNRDNISTTADRAPQTIGTQSSQQSASVEAVQSMPVGSGTYAKSSGEWNNPAQQQSQLYNQNNANVASSQQMQNSVLNTPASNDYYMSAQPSYGQQRQIMASTTPAVKIGLLLPLSGQHAELGQSMLQAAQLALFDMNDSNLELTPRDTKGTSSGARQAAQEAIEDGAQILLGPIFSHAVKGAKDISNKYGVPMIGFSTDWRVAGGNTLIMGVLPFGQAERIAQFAAQRNFQRIGIIAPNNDYGDAVVNAFRARAQNLGLTIVTEERFTDGSSNISTEVRRFAQYDQRQQRLEQERNRLKEAGDSRGLKELKTSLTHGDAPYDAIFVPVGGDQAKSLINLLSYYDLGTDKVTYLGTGLWDDSGIQSEPAAQGAFYAAPAPEARHAFEQKYASVYGRTPPRLVSLAYDATALAVVLARQGIARNGRPDFSPQALLNPNGFSGIDGIFRFRRDGLVERALAVHEVRNSSSSVVVPARKSFQSGQF